MIRLTAHDDCPKPPAAIIRSHKVARAAHPSCAICMLGDRNTDGGAVGWTTEYGLDNAACIRAIDPTTPCANVVHCTGRRIEDSCWLCQYEPPPAHEVCVKSVVTAIDETGDVDADSETAATRCSIPTPETRLTRVTRT